MDELLIPEIELEVKETEDIILKVEEGSMPDAYHGNYVVIPKPDIEQKLDTKNKSMSDDVTVTEIPYHEVSNQQGTTVIIGGI